MKKKLMKAAALMMAAAMAAAMPAAVMADEAEKVTIRFSWWGGDARHQQTLEAIELYESLNPNIHIEAEYQGYDGYYEKMITTLSSGTAPDLMQYHRDWVADVQGADHYLANLSELPVDLSTLPENVLNTSGSFNEEPVLYSCSVGGQVMYVNKDFAEKYNFDYEKEYTWEELMEEGSRIHEEDPEAYLMTADIDVLNRLIVLEYLAQLTGESIVTDDYKIAFTVEQMTASLENILALYESNTMEPYGESAVFVGQMEQNNKWVNGQIGLLLDISGAVAKYDASIECGVDIMAIPGQEDEVCTGVDYSGNMGFVINDNSANKEETAKFLSWMMNDEEAIKILKDCRGFPATSSAIETLKKEELLSDVLAKANATAGAGQTYSINAISGNTEMETIRKDAIEQVIYGDITPEEAAQDIYDAYEELLEELSAEE